MEKQTDRQTNTQTPVKPYPRDCPSAWVKIYFVYWIQVEATDRDLGVNAQLSYRLSPQTDHADVFSIDADNGQIYIRSALDYERNAWYHLTVTAYDGVARNQPEDSGQKRTPDSDHATSKVRAPNTWVEEFRVYY